MRPTSILFALCLALAAAARAEFRPEATAPANTVPSGMNYQGRLEKDGFPVTGTKTMVFRLFNVATGGSALWNSGNTSVSVTQGLFSVVLDIPFSALMGNTQKYLELEVDGVTLAPRDPVRSVPFAKVAQTVEGTIDISTAGLTFQTAVGDSLAISSVSGRVGIGTSSPSARLHVSSGTGETGNILIVSTGASTLVSIDGNGQLTANTFVGDGTGLRNLVRRSGDSMSGPLTLNGSTLTVLGNAFSVNTSDLWVGGSKVGVLTASPNTALEVNGTAQFGQNATKSTFSATGGLALDRNSSLTVGTTFYVGNGRIGVNTLSPATTIQVLGDVYIGNPTVHDLSAASDLLVEGNFIVDGTFIQHTGSFSQFEQLGVSAAPQAGQTFEVGYTSFVVTSGGKTGVMTTTPLATLTVNGDSSFANPSTFASSVTVRGEATVTSTLTVNGTGFSVGVNRLVVAPGGNVGAGTASPLATLSVNGDAFVANPATFGSSVTVRGEATVTSTLTVNGTGFSVGSNKLVVAAGGNVGAGTASPLATLSVNGDSSFAQPSTFKSSVTVVGAFSANGNAGFGTTAPLAQLSVNGDSSFAQPSTFQSSVTVAGAFSAAGNTGLGTTSPLAKLSVVGDSSFSQPSTFQSSVTVAGAFSAAGNTGLGTAAPLAKLSVVGDSSFSNPATFGSSVTVRSEATVTSTLTVNGTGFSVGSTKLVVAAGGNVGVGTASPLAALSVNGDSSFSSAATFKSSVTATGQIRIPGTAPAASLCGTSPSVSGSDSAGKVTIGTGGPTTSCTLTFNTAFAVAPACTVLGNNAAANLAATSTTNTLVFTSSVDMTSYVVMYICIGQ